MKVLVTGASGGLGARLMLSLAACGEISLRALVHDRPVTLEGVETVAGDLGDPKSLVAATRDVETVVHLAALTHSRTENDYIRVNVEGTVHLIEACSRNGVDRLIFMEFGSGPVGWGRLCGKQIEGGRVSQRFGAFLGSFCGPGRCTVRG